MKLKHPTAHSYDDILGYGHHQKIVIASDELLSQILPNIGVEDIYGDVIQDFFVAWHKPTYGDGASHDGIHLSS